MELAYFVFTNDELLKEITKWHILKYIHFPSIFLEKLCDDKNIGKLKWLFDDKYVTIESLNTFSNNLFFVEEEEVKKYKHFCFIVEDVTFYHMYF
jgi:hypothetical protein